MSVSFLFLSSISSNSSGLYILPLRITLLISEICWLLSPYIIRSGSTAGLGIDETVDLAIFWEGLRVRRGGASNNKRNSWWTVDRGHQGWNILFERTQIAVLGWVYSSRGQRENHQRKDINGWTWGPAPRAWEFKGLNLIFWEDRV